MAGNGSRGSGGGGAPAGSDGTGGDSGLSIGGGTPKPSPPNVEPRFDPESDSGVLRGIRAVERGGSRISTVGGLTGSGGLSGLQLAQYNLPPNASACALASSTSAVAMRFSHWSQ